MERTRIYLITEFPFYAAMLNQCIVRWSERITTACIGLNGDGNPVMLVNKDFFYSLSEYERVGLLQHELLHLAQGHLFRGTDLNHSIANQAMDIAINQYIPSEFLPKCGLLPDQFGLPKGKSFEAYYVELIKRPSPPQGSSLDDHNWQKVLEEEGEPAPSGSVEVQKEVVQDIVDKAVAQAEGTQPGSVSKAIKESLTAVDKVKRDWKAELRRYIGRNYSDDKVSTRNRPNRRMGLKAAGSRRVELPKIIIGIDHSGSIDYDMVKKFINEASWMLAAVKERVEIVYFDARILHSEKLSKFSDENVRYGQGGTSFQCVVDHASKVRPDLLIMLTDGECNVENYPKFPILWGIIGNASTDHLKGKVIKLC